MHDRDEASNRETADSGDVSWRKAMIVSGLALSLPAMMFGPPVVGYWFDSMFGTSPWFTLSFLAVGFLGTALNVYVILKRMRLFQ
jgi:F0F1-type ATP synthase assembly protein I